jgi:hypothetical protein
MISTPMSSMGTVFSGKAQVLGVLQHQLLLPPAQGAWAADMEGALDQMQWSDLAAKRSNSDWDADHADFSPGFIPFFVQSAAF